MRITGRSAERAYRAAGREFAHIEFGENDGPGLAELADKERIVRRDRPRQKAGTGRRRKIGCVDVVLQDNGDAVQRGAWTVRSPLRVERAGLFPGAGIQGDDGVEFRSGLVIGLDASEVQPNQQLRSQRASVERPVQFLDARRRHIDRLRRGERRKRES